MAEYRIYCLDRDGRIIRRVDLECASDGDAYRKAHGHNAENDVEVWSGKRRLYVIDRGSKPPKDAG